MKKLVLLLSMMSVGTVFSSEGSCPDISGPLPGSIVLEHACLEMQMFSIKEQRGHQRDGNYIVDLRKTWEILNRAARVLAQESEWHNQAHTLIHSDEIPLTFSLQHTQPVRPRYDHYRYQQNFKKKLDLVPDNHRKVNQSVAHRKKSR